jgi:hypothetical protein
VGAQLGVQFLIANRVVFDIFLLGPEANSSKQHILMKDISSTMPWDPAMAADAEKELKDIVQDVPIIGDKVEVKVNSSAKEVTADYSGFLPGFRGGISIGLRF